ncbi:MAG: S-layer homology domain-containing protein [Clostridia bacterium]|nr:S-layer homology domain-containing protein [Clostridia bacterium]
MKKINAIFLLIALLINITAFSGVQAQDIAQENTENPYAEEQEVLVALDIMSKNSEGEIDNSKEITRAEFVDTAAKFINVNPAEAASYSYFYDVPVDSWYTNSLNILTDLKIISQNEEKKFYPDRVITVDEATKMIVCLLGYRIFAEQRGGYPSGYRAIASELGLKNKLPSGTALTNAHMTALLYNAIDIEMADIQLEGGSINVSKDGKRILEANRNIYKTDGVIESVYGLSAYGDNVAERFDVSIGGNLYTTDEYERVRDNFGRRVRFYYQENEDDELTLVYFEPYYDDDTVMILSDDFEGYEQSSNTVSYTAAGRSKRAVLSSDMVVLKNGAIVSSNASEAFNIVNGEIKLVDSNDDNKYDICCIYDFKTVVANNVSTDDRVFTYKLVSDPATEAEKENYNGVFDFSENSVDYLTVYSSVGTVVDFAAITQNTVLDIAVSDDNKYATIYINSEIIEGTLSGISVTDKELEVAGENYDFYNGVQDIYYLKLGDSGKFKLNRYGKISYFEKIANAGEVNPAVYIVNVNYNTDEEGYMIKYYDSTGTFYTKKVSENIKLDGAKITLDLYEVLSKLKRTVVILKVNSKDEIISIDSGDKANNEDDSSLISLISFDGNGIKWNSATKMFGKNVVCSSDAVVFVVPPILSEYEAFADDEQSYSIGSLSDFISNELNDVDCYKYGASSYCNIIVLYKYKYQNPYRNRFMMVTSVSEALGANDESITKISGYQSGELVSYDVSNTYKVGTTPDCDIVIGKGDIITVGKKDNEGLVGNIEVHFDVSRNWSGLNQICLGGYMFDSYSNRNYDALYYWLNVFTDLQANTRFIAGCPTEIDGNLIKFKYPEVEGGRDSAGAYKWRMWHLPSDFDSFDEIAIVKSTTPIIVYDAEADTIEKGSVTDICTADSYDCPSQILFDMRWGEVICLFVINNNEAAWTKPDVIE